MDNFIDKLAQKFTAGEVIRANSAAEERELKRLREQVAQYERCLQEMRQVQMINTQTAQQLHDLMVESVENMQKQTAESAEAFSTLTKESLIKITEVQTQTDEQKAEARQSLEAAAATVEEMENKVEKMQETVAKLTEALEKNQKEVAEWFRQADDFLHKENVKVYRNVQAVVVDEVGNKAESVIKAQEENTKKIGKPILIFTILGFATAVASLVIQILELLNFKII